MEHTGEELDMNQLNEALNQPESVEELPPELNTDAKLREALDRALTDAKDFQKKQRKARWIFRIWLVLSTLGMIALLGVVGWMYRGQVVQDWDRYGSNSANCIFKVGDRTVRGVREYSYRYYTIFNWRIYDMRQLEEKTFIEMPNNGASVLAHLSDGTHPRVTVKDAEPGRYPLPHADSYSFFMDNGKNTDVISYKDMCK